ncbi:MAG: dihydrofolate reductase [Planctomycetota bacterium]
MSGSAPDSECDRPSGAAARGRRGGVAIVVAMAENGVIGRDNALPWHLPDDLKRFRALTLDHAVIMGRNTWDSIGRPLPRRRCIVLTRQPDWHAAGALRAAGLEEALALIPDDETAFVIGGASVYRAALPIADRLHVTIVHASVEGDVRFPDLDLSQWRLVERTDRDADETHEHAFSFLTYERVAAT